LYKYICTGKKLGRNLIYIPVMNPGYQSRYQQCSLYAGFFLFYCFGLREKVRLLKMHCTLLSLYWSPHSSCTCPPWFQWWGRHHATFRSIAFPFDETLMLGMGHLSQWLCSPLPAKKSLHSWQGIPPPPPVYSTFSTTSWKV